MLVLWCDVLMMQCGRASAVRDAPRCICDAARGVDGQRRSETQRGAQAMEHGVWADIIGMVCCGVLTMQYGYWCVLVLYCGTLVLWCGVLMMQCGHRRASETQRGAWAMQHEVWAGISGQRRSVVR
jgi:hypothetical protein